ncbi:MAG: type II toxin-antitoxin system MqsA family antitoxin [Chloroflexi bacterium]|nr:MAG: type II toxin-antitoxin system MqsA family antitoxin [Chloroflexota bacterium]
MQCLICRYGQTFEGQTTVTLEREGTTLVSKAVPALICDTCGEVYLEDEIGSKLLAKTQEAARTGVQVEVRNYALAA